MRAAPVSLDPADRDSYAPNATARAHIASLIFDTLVRLDSRGRLQPALATRWQSDAEGRRWELWLRPGVRFHDGLSLTASDVAASLSAAEPKWKVSATTASVVIEPDAPTLDLPAQLARTRYAIVKRNSGSLDGTGPFRLAQQSQPAHRLVLSANPDYWSGRPYLDSIEIQMARSPRDQLVDLQLGRADAVELAPDLVRRASQQGQRVVSSASLDVLALAFVPGRPAVDDPRVRDVIASTVDRSAIQSVLLQRGGQANAALLPQWMSGYAFLFPVGRDLPHALQVRAELPPMPQLTLVYDSADPLAQGVAERIALNVREAGLNIQVFGELMAQRAGNADIRLVRVHLASSDPMTALAAAAADFSLPAPATGAAPDQLYQAERALLLDHRVVPLVDIPESMDLAPRVHDWSYGPEGGWRLADVWVEAAQ